MCVNKLAGYEALSFQEVMQILKQGFIFQTLNNLFPTLTVILKPQMKDMDVKGTGDIEFDEFIYFMTRPQVKTPNVFKLLEIYFHM